MDDSLPHNEAQKIDGSVEANAPKQTGNQALPVSPLPEHAISHEKVELSRFTHPVISERISSAFSYANQVRRGKFLFAFAFIAIFIFFGIRLLRMAGVNNLSQENFVRTSQSPFASPSQEFSEGTSVFILPSDVDVEGGGYY